MNDYGKIADDFLRKYQIKFTITKVAKQTCPIWDDDQCRHGYKYKVTFSRFAGVSADRTWFYFWGSLIDRKADKVPSAYDVLACIRSDVHCPDTFEEFCSEYGYDTDSRRAEKTFKACKIQSKKLRSFFSKAEIAELEEIQ